MKKFLKGKNLPRKWRNRCDALLTPLVMKLHPFCLLCGSRTQVAHHFIHKSKSSRLRYEITNLIPLCGSCHLRLHCNEGFESARIIEKKGLEWFKKLEKMKNEIVKTDNKFYEDNYNYLLERFNKDDLARN